MQYSCVHKKSPRDPSKNGSWPIWAVFPQKNVQYTKLMFVLVRMQLHNHVNTHIGSKAFQALQRLCGIYMILNLDCC